MGEERLKRADPRAAARVVEPSADGFQCVSVAPTVWVFDDFADESTCRRARAVAERFAAADPHTRDNSTGRSCELPVDSDPVVTGILERIVRLFGVRPPHPSTMRFRHYRDGESHPPHCDHFQIGDRWLVATAMLVLAAEGQGGETSFTAANPELSIAPRRGRLISWLNHTADGHSDASSRHEGLPVRNGEKVTLTAFLYDDPLSCPVLRDRHDHSPAGHSSHVTR